MARHQRTTRSLLLGATALAGALALSTGTAAAQQQEFSFDLPAQPLDIALRTYARTAEQQVIFAGPDVLGRKSAPVSGRYSAEEALQIMLAGSDLTVQRTAEGVLQVARAADPQGGSAAGGGAEVEALIVTAQKREEDIQDVPIAISAFTQEDLTRSQVAGGPDLMTQVPNMTFTKTNFASYSIQIRGIGTQAISATTDPAVAVAFNNTPFVRNRFFEQEFYDLERVEVLRGPQGTLYGRNATAGVVNIISAKPKFYQEARISADVGNYRSTRMEGMVNIPLVEDAVALRLAGAWTKRDGYATNAFNGNSIDGRDLWSTRLSLRFAPTEALDVNLIWEHFEEDDDRIRSGKQLCKKDTRNSIAGIPFNDASPGVNSSAAATYNQGCVAASLYASDSFQTPNGFSLPYIHPLRQLGLPTTGGMDPYANQNQSRDLRVVESLVDPQYRAKADVFQIQASYDLTKYLTVQSETAYSTDELFSTQDYNRYITSKGIFSQSYYDGIIGQVAENVLNDGVFCDPQIGCSDRLVAIDLSTADSRNFSQEFRVSSDYEGPFNFNLGVNYTRYDTQDKYYVFINSLSMWSALVKNDAAGAPPYAPGETTNDFCLEALVVGNPNEVQGIECIYMDPNPIGALNDLGHNYFLSRNPYRLISYAGFGEAYYSVTPDLKITAGLRYTVDKKHAPLIPSWLLAGDTIGYPVKKVLDLEWREPTGRLAIDWKPHLSFTDETLVYGSYARGYKAGGANPPPMVVVAGQLKRTSGAAESVIHPETFDAEFVDAFEIGTKNTLLDGALTLNASAFYYDYQGYQISRIIDRTAVNSNFDAEVWGLEIEADWRPLENLRLGFKGGYQNTRLADGMQAIDLMDRTAGNPDWVVAKPFPSLASNCILPVWLVTHGGVIRTLPAPGLLGDTGFCVEAYISGNDPATKLPYVPNPTVRLNPAAHITGTPTLPLGWPGYPGFDPSTAPNFGAGFFKDLSGNELPNAPHFTGTLTADYTVPLPSDWTVNLHADLYYQSEAWLRIFNTEGYDKLKAYTNLNLAAIFTNEDAGWTVMAYVKNVMDRDSITGAFLNSEDSGLTTNVFLTEPRLYGIRVTKAFSDAPLLGGWLGEPREGPYPFTLELGGQVQRHDAPYETLDPSFSDAFSPVVDPLQSQHRDLDWGDGREARLIYKARGPWSMAAGVRFGKTNLGTSSAESEFGGSLLSCVYRSDCIRDPERFTAEVENFSTTDVRSQEEHAVVDFEIGYDVGIGGDGEDAVFRPGVGLRYAKLNSSTVVGMVGIPRWELPEYEIEKYQIVESQRTQYEADLVAQREFEGAGPTVSFDGEVPLFGGVNLDLSVTGGVLFGKQRTKVTGQEVETYTSDRVFGGAPFTPDLITTTPVAFNRTTSVTTPVLDVGVGLSYQLDRVGVRVGYSWERYFDALDIGYDEARDGDRTIDGPYFKLSFGFGG